jgi:probable phosphoglycerate mutase
MELILIRHGLPERVETKDGSPADPPLTEQGRAQAAATAAQLQVDRIDRIYASPLKRAHQTALPLAERLGLEIALEPRIAEYDRDSDTYIPLEELKQTDPEAWRAFMKLGYPADMDLETFNHEVVVAIEEIIAENTGRCVAVVCHGGVINAWASHILEMGFRLFFDARYASINRFMAASSGERSVISLNEAAHLRGLL